MNSKPASAEDSVGGSRLLRRAFRARQADQRDGGAEEDEAHDAHQHRARHIDQAAQRRAADHRHLVGRGPGRHRARQHRSRHHGRHQSVDGRHLESARAAEQEHRREQQIAAERAGEQGERNDDRDQRVDALRDPNDQPPVVAVGGVSDQQRQHDGGHELDQADQAEVEGAAGDLVDLPADHHGQHLIAHGGGDPRQPEQHERPLLRAGRPTAKRERSFRQRR